MFTVDVKQQYITSLGNDLLIFASEQMDGLCLSYDMVRFGPVPVQIAGRFGPVPFQSGCFDLGRFSQILEVGRFGPVLEVRFGTLYFL